MLTFLLWCILFIVCWPLALLALVLYPFVWIMLLPFRLVGIAVHGALAPGFRELDGIVLEMPPALLQQKNDSMGCGDASGTAPEYAVPDLKEHLALGI